MTVAQLEAEMSNDEYVRWGVYLARRGQKQQQEANKARAKKSRKGGRR